MADQNVNIQIFDREGNPQPGAVPPPGTGASPQQPNQHAPQPQASQPEPPQPVKPLPPENFEHPLLSISDILVQGMAPVSDAIFGRPITSAVTASYKAMRQIGRSTFDIYKALNPPSPETPDGTEWPREVPIPKSPVAATNGPVAPATTAAGATQGATTAASAAGGAGATAAGASSTGAGAAAAGGAGGGGAAAGGGVAAAGGGAAAASSAAGPIGIAIAVAVVATIGAITALTAAFLYAKDKFLEAADDVAPFSGAISSAKANQDIQALYDRMNRAQSLENTFTELVNLQTQANHHWEEVKNALFRLYGPAVITGLETLAKMLAVLNSILHAVVVLRNHVNDATIGVLSIVQHLPFMGKIAETLKKILSRTEERLTPDQKSTLDMIDLAMKANLKDAMENKGIPRRNKGLGF